MGKEFGDEVSRTITVRAHWRRKPRREKRKKLKAAAHKYLGIRQK